MKYQFLFIIVLLLCFSCEMRVEESKPKVVLNSQEEDFLERVNYVNTPLDIFSSTTKGASLSSKSTTVEEALIDLTSPMKEGDAYTRVIDGEYSQALTVEVGDVICISSNAIFTGTLNMNGGTLAVFGKVDMGWNWFLGGSGLIIINSGASFYVNYFEHTSGIKLVNYGSLSFSEWSGFNIAGQFENYSDLTVNSVSLKSGGKFYNSGRITVNNSVTIDDVFENEGSVDVKSNFYLNANGQLLNYCSFFVKEMMTVDGYLGNYSYLKVSGDLFLNSKRGVELFGNSLIEVNNVTIDAEVSNSDDAIAIVYSTGSIIHNSGSVDDNVMITTLEDECYVSSTSCSPGYGLVPEFSLVAEIASPIIGGQALSATSVHIVEDVAYVTYHLNGEKYGGAIELIALDEVGRPMIKQQFSSSDFDFNELSLDDHVSYGNKRKMWVVGAQRLSSSETLQSPAMMAEFTIFDNMITDENIGDIVDVEGYSGNSVQRLDDVLLVTSGSNGGVSVIDNATKSVSSFSTLDFMKYLIVSDDHIVSLIASITGAQLQCYSSSSSDFSTPECVADLGVINPYDGKLVLTIDNEEVFVACGSSGIKVFDIESLEQLAEYEPENGITNGVVTDDDFVYLANGSGGLEILEKHNLSPVGVYDFDGSANYVAVQDGYIFIANGTGGLEILYRSL